MIQGFESKIKQIITVTPRLIAFDFITLEALTKRKANQPTHRH